VPSTGQPPAVLTPQPGHRARPLGAVPPPRRPVSLFAFHHAGGSTASFTGWQKALGDRVEVVAVPLPTTTRADDGPVQLDLTSVLIALHEQLAPRLSGPHLFYGHSMGALLAYHLTRLRAARGLRPPLRLITGAFPAPHLPHALARVLQLPDERLARWLVDVSGVPETLLRHPRRLDRQLSLLRRDLRLCAGHRHSGPVVPLPCPVDALVGDADPIVDVADGAAWQLHSAPGHTLRVLQGGHFFPRDDKQAFFQEIARLIDLAVRPR
jgi:surfactin synthase thioesterase subunit